MRNQLQNYAKYVKNEEKCGTKDTIKMTYKYKMGKGRCPAG